MRDEWKNVILLRILSDMFYRSFVSATDVSDFPDQVTYRISRIYLFMRLKKKSSVYLRKQIYLLFIYLNVSENFTQSLSLVIQGQLCFLTYGIVCTGNNLF